MFYGFICVVIFATAPVLTRDLNQARSLLACGKQKHQCRNGACIPFHAVCDGKVDCSDGSDETHYLCRESICQYNWFRCTYGACVDGTAPCNGIQECADNSDELLPMCDNETLEENGRFTCSNGISIPSSDHCDGVVHCPDGSDETVRSCASQHCLAYYFQCAYGACVDHGADCNGTIECADGSDEASELCGTIVDLTTQKPPKRGNCILPRYPDNGIYVVVNSPNAEPGKALEYAQLGVRCNPGYTMQGNDSLFCYDGKWSGDMAICTRFCKLSNHPSVTYKCYINASEPALGFRDCSDRETSGTLVKPECNPNYHTTGVIPNMRCNNGIWDYIVICMSGASKNGTNVTIIIMDKVEVYVSNFQYVATAVTPSTNDVDYDAIDENDWRMGPAKRKNGTTINLNIRNNTITVYSNDSDSIVFRDDRK